MDHPHNKKRMNVEDDRLSSLPDDLIHKILSLIGIKPAIETSVLSSRWRNTWTSMPYLDFSTKDFSSLTKFSNFVTHVLSRRNNVAEVFSLKLCVYKDVGVEFVKQILDYGFFHNIQQLSIAFFLKKYSIELPISLFSSKSLKHLSLTSELRCWSHHTFSLSHTATSTWELPALTTLCLDEVHLCDGDNSNDCSYLFAKCANLEDLTLQRCRTKGCKSLSICNPRLSTLKLGNFSQSWEVFKVVAPLLKNLSTTNFERERYWISAPQLSVLIYSGFYSPLLYSDGLHSLEKVHLRVYKPEDADARLYPHLFKKFKSVKFLTLNLEIVEFLSKHVEIISNQPSPFVNLKSLKIRPDREELSKAQERENVGMSAEVKSYLLDSSPGVVFTMVTREEIRAMKDANSAQDLMTGLQTMLKREKADTETNGVHMERRETRAWSPMDEEDMARHENELQMANINRCWEDMSVQIEKGKEKTGDIVSRLQAIKDVMIKLPTTKRAEMQPCFSSLCEEANTVVNKIIDRVNLQCNMKRSHFNVCFQELALKPQQPS